MAEVDPYAADTEEPDFDLDASVALAWFEFRERLTRHVRGMSVGDALILAVPSAHDDELYKWPFVQFYLTDKDLLLCEVSSNTYRFEGCRLSPDDERWLLTEGWEAPIAGDDDFPNFYLNVSPREADRVASMAVAALRDLFAAAHPTFIDATASGGAGHFDVGRAPDPVPELPLAQMPADHDELVDLVSHTISCAVGCEVEWDSDGDIGVSVEGITMFVRVIGSVLAVEAFTPLVVAVTNRTRAAEVLADLNLRHPIVKFGLVHDAVHASVQMQAEPYVSSHLMDALELLAGTSRGLGETLAARLGGTYPFGGIDE